MTTRDSSHYAIAELRTLRLARVQERARAEAERRAREQRERAASERQANAERMQAMRQSTGATRPSAPLVQRVSRATIERVSRTTIERIASLRGELEQIASERAQAVRERAERIDALNARLMERRSHWLPITTGLLVAGVVFGGLVAYAPTSSVASSAVPQAPASFEQVVEREGHGALDDDVSEATQVALLEQAAIPRVEGDAGTPELPATATPEPAPKEKPAAVIKKKRPGTSAPAGKAAAKPKKAKVGTPALDPFGNIDGCGDDPICGLGF
jgi:hypothetical protein